MLWWVLLLLPADAETWRKYLFLNGEMTELVNFGRRHFHPRDLNVYVC